MKIAVIGAGAIGSLVAGYLKLKGEEVTLVGRPDSVIAVREDGLRISGVRGDAHVKINISDKLDYTPGLVILATKTQDISRAIKDNLEYLKEVTILTTQNGIQAEHIAARSLPEKNILSSIVMFGATYLLPGKVVHNFEGSWIIGKIFGPRPDERLISASMILDKAFPTVISEEIEGMKYLKIFVNANNCLPAILGLTMQEAFSDLQISRISIGLWKEGFQIISKLGIKLVSLPGFPVENLTKLTSLPSEEAAKVFSGIMAKLSKDPLYGSILQSIKRERASEIDYINGEFVTLAKNHGLTAPLNRELVAMVHQVEKNKKFFTKNELFSVTKYLMQEIL
ncbi:MAG TPA: ketopantoate reductase family protein [Candidatus Omnitrophota bacterium]|nr:ketopantoate reductase family protein [Candidatus Omnitrophota bacterium]